MGAPLYDITIYYNGTKIKDAPEDLSFRNIVNYIADFYHDKLDRYKPKKTGRICVHLGTEIQWNEPNYFGSICHISNIIDEDKFLNFIKKEDKFKYILELLHETILIASRHLNWDDSKFINSYNQILQSDFKFRKEYKLKKSKSRKKSAYAIIEKDDQKAKLIFKINKEKDSSEIEVIEKMNLFWYDQTYKIAQESKWINENTFGYISKDKSSFAYYNLGKGLFETNLKFEETD